MDVQIEAESVIARLRSRIGDDATTIAILQAQLEVQAIELTKLRSEAIDAAK